MSETYNFMQMQPNGADIDTAGEEAIVEAVSEGVEETMPLSPPSVRSFAETMIGQYRAAYERARESMDEAVSMLEVTIEPFENVSTLLSGGHEPAQIHDAVTRHTRGSHRIARGVVPHQR